MQIRGLGHECLSKNGKRKCTSTRSSKLETGSHPGMPQHTEIPAHSIKHSRGQTAMLDKKNKLTSLVIASHHIILPTPIQSVPVRLVNVVKPNVVVRASATAKHKNIGPDEERIASNPALVESASCLFAISFSVAALPAHCVIRSSIPVAVRPMSRLVRSKTADVA